MDAYVFSTQRETHTHTHAARQSHQAPLLSPKKFFGGLWKWHRWATSYYSSWRTWMKTQTEVDVTSSFRPTHSFVVRVACVSSLFKRFIAALQNERRKGKTQKHLKADLTWSHGHLTQRQTIVTALTVWHMNGFKKTFHDENKLVIVFWTNWQHCY